jgi:SBF-like CPA transporter family (DUF4137)
MVAIMTIAWLTLGKMYPNNPKLRVMGLFGCSHKSVATGIPMIQSIYGGLSTVGIYTLPILIWHPMSLVVGTCLSPYLCAFVEREQKRLGLDESDEPLILGEDAAAPPRLDKSQEKASSGEDENGTDSNDKNTSA